MAERVERVTKTTTSAAPAAGERVTQSEVREATVSGPALAARIITFITGVLLILLAFRFVLALLGANPNNAFARFIYDLSYPFVAPFFNLFGYRLHYGISRFEVYTLVAMLVYGIVGWLLARLVTLGSSDTDV